MWFSLRGECKGLISSLIKCTWIAIVLLWTTIINRLIYISCQVLLSKCACNISITTRLDMLYFCSIKVRSKETPIGSVLGDVTVVFPPGLHAKLFQWLSRLHRSSSGQNLDRNSHRVKNSSASKRTFNKDVQIIQHHLNDQRSADATTVGRPDLYEESFTCIMENYLSHSQ